jgi:phage-related protein
VGDSKKDLRRKERKLAEWAYQEEAKPLIFPEEPDKYYLAKATGDTDVSETGRIGIGTISFLCTDPFAYLIEEKEILIPLGDHKVTVCNQGGIKAYPKMEFEFKDRSTEFIMRRDGGEEALYFGQAVPVDGIPPVSKREILFQDDCSSTTGWTTGVGVDGGNVTGSFESTGTYVRVLDYGSVAGTKHGPAGIKTFHREIQDFTLEVEIGFKSIYPYQIGRIEVYLLDVNNARIGKIVVRDVTIHRIAPSFEARLGNQSRGHYFVNTEGKRGKYTQLNGRVTLRRIEESWTFELTKKDTKGNYTDKWSAKYMDREHRYMAKLAGIQIHIGACGKYQPYSTAYINKIKVWEEKRIDLSKQVPFLFEKGDHLSIDSETGTILKNGEPFYHALHPESHFINLTKGTNKISFSPLIVQGKISFKERWM